MMYNQYMYIYTYTCIHIYIYVYFARDLCLLQIEFLESQL